MNIFYNSGLLLCIVFAMLFVGCNKEKPDAPFTVRDFDGNVYETVIIEHQEWMAENLRVTHYNDGSPIDYVTGNEDWSYLETGAYSWYDNDDMGNKYDYGALYNGYAVITEKLCPAGWRVPSDIEWVHLVNLISGGWGPGGNMLKSCRQVNSPLGEGCATNLHPRWDMDDEHYGYDEFGFAALPGGMRAMEGSFQNLGGMGGWYTSTFFNVLNPFDPSQIAYVGDIRLIRADDHRVMKSSPSMRSGLSVRCIKDSP